MTRVLPRDTEQRLQAELDGRAHSFWPFRNVHRAVEFFFETRERAGTIRSNGDYKNWKDWDGHPDPLVPERAQRTYAALLYCFQDYVPGDCPGCTSAEESGTCPALRPRPRPCSVRHKRLLTRRRRWILEQLYGLRRPIGYVADECNVEDERTLWGWVEECLDILRRRLKRRGLLRQKEEE